MKSYLTDFNEISKVLAGRDRAQALDDLNAERSGLSTGRMTRFLHDTAHDGLSDNKRSKDDGDALDFALVAQQSYEALLNNTWDRLRDAETAAERALQRAQDELAASAAALQTTLDRAATLPDGTRVFPDEAGQVWSERHDAVDPILAASIEWQGFEPSFETLVIRQDAVAHDQGRIDIIRGHQVTLGEYRERLDAGDLSRDELEDIGESIDEIMTSTSPHHATDMQDSSPVASVGLELPELGS